MIKPTTIKFLKELDKNNNKAWFEEHRKNYEAAKMDFQHFTGSLIKEIAVFDKPIGELVAKNCCFRINRDVRFSKNKNPYKNNMGGYFNKDGKNGPGAGYYFHLQPGGSFAAGGIWMPEPAVLVKIRQEIDYNFIEWNNLIKSSAFKKNFQQGLVSTESLVRPPKGYEIDNPAIHFIKMKSFIVSKKLTDAEISDKGIVNNITKTFKAMKPMINFLNRALD